MQTLSHEVATTPPFVWEDHHFIAGSPALDCANSVVYRLDAGRREDRFLTPQSVNAWAAAAGLSVAPVTRAELPGIIAAREAIDCFFRTCGKPGPSRPWQRLVRLYARHVGGLALEPSPALAASLLHEAMSLSLSPSAGRVRVCGGCGWLFIDRTRNGSKRWCISALCGNRDKARRHYHRRKLAG